MAGNDGKDEMGRVGIMVEVKRFRRRRAPGNRRIPARSSGRDQNIRSGGRRPCRLQAGCAAPAELVTHADAGADLAVIKLGFTEARIAGGRSAKADFMGGRMSASAMTLRPQRGAPTARGRTRSVSTQRGETWMSAGERVGVLPLSKASAGVMQSRVVFNPETFPSPTSSLVSAASVEVTCA
jgi:hypothetical protein